MTKPRPYYPGGSLRGQLKWLLGQPVEEHALVKNDPHILKKINMCTCVKEVVEVLNAKHEMETGKRKSLPGGGRFNYWFYKDENR